MSKYLGGFSDTAEYIGKFVNQIKGDEYTSALERCRERFDEVEIDRLRVKPIVKITGEFWAQTTEGDGNFNMFRFLEREGGHVDVRFLGVQAANGNRPFELVIALPAAFAVAA